MTRPIHIGEYSKEETLCGVRRVGKMDWIVLSNLAWVDNHKDEFHFCEDCQEILPAYLIGQ